MGSTDFFRDLRSEGLPLSIRRKPRENQHFYGSEGARDRPGMRDFSLDNPAAIRYYREVASGEAGF
ncbi:hypothetical protein HMPREF1986_00199 [Oribacterium sp. oral taxon 078 str. F0263]|nr:hypothetical protein HMPREF1986_00199 [Oribacterium sp. oral taxon 078 str. F0263]